MTEYQMAMQKNREASRIHKRISDGYGSFEDLYDFAGIAGRVAGDCIIKQLGNEYPNGHVTEDDVRLVVSPILRETHQIVAEAASDIQNDNFKKAGTGLKAMTPEYNLQLEDEFVRELSRRSFGDELDG